MKKIVSVLLVLISAVTFAGGGNPPAPGGGMAPPPALPINQYVLVLLAVGIIIYFWQLKLKKIK